MKQVANPAQGLDWSFGYHFRFRIWGLGGGGAGWNYAERPDANRSFRHII